MSESKHVNDMIPSNPENLGEVKALLAHLDDYRQKHPGLEWVLIRKPRNGRQETMPYLLQNAQDKKYVTRATLADQYAQLTGEQPPEFMQI